ncbi:SidA/IucD/PvdA family monooxygenase [Kitasatospora purpeofusca]|uniref:SidA/IucD/PvdA family monooxygenase n=1 Tax=Kitasatospora purpeofusca TaxID=67352 RepID=UPI00225B81B9|nr:SidA/IucD/PvdA family monooxygenase [Kitasatospora purpeofusca]MCX4755226.1 SidA/IucD/PvdA family monooxygenase [Kitasatospora purpeofusca]WSR37576.1 SidA/IucD/PvdA family monooxygenase [Kitasatospora purpeofusca]WSR45824.1 SidA/IucD/PvdA family monooxygenase [Kitasatospora purpeofusca]
MRTQRMTSDGVSADLLDAIHAQLYRLDALRTGRCAYRLSPGQELLAVDGGAGDAPIDVVTRDIDTDSVHRELVDVVILATGYRNRTPAYLEPLRELIPVDEDGAFRVREDYSIESDGPPGCRIFVQSAAGHTHGVADANLSVMAWRNAVIANAVAGRAVYNTDRDSSTVTWSQAAAPHATAPHTVTPHATTPHTSGTTAPARWRPWSRRRSSACA